MFKTNGNIKKRSNSFLIFISGVININNTKLYQLVLSTCILKFHYRIDLIFITTPKNSGML
ncbi:hypothetical protein DBR40_09990 [Pedobacter sp. KBW01]|nr:hypothetical protein DBR40_09990 [Pedobacter sp. KBW01]